MLTERAAAVTLCHTRAHTGVAGNEAADAVAELAMTTDSDEDSETRRYSANALRTFVSYVTAGAAATEHVHAISERVTSAVCVCV